MTWKSLLLKEIFKTIWKKRLWVLKGTYYCGFLWIGTAHSFKRNILTMQILHKQHMFNIYCQLYSVDLVSETEKIIRETGIIIKIMYIGVWFCVISRKTCIFLRWTNIIPVYNIKKTINSVFCVGLQITREYKINLRIYFYNDLSGLSYIKGPPQNINYIIALQSASYLILFNKNPYSLSKSNGIEYINVFQLQY